MSYKQAGIHDDQLLVVKNSNAALTYHKYLPVSASEDVLGQDNEDRKYIVVELGGKHNNYMYIITYSIIQCLFKMCVHLRNIEYIYISIF